MYRASQEAIVRKVIDSMTVSRAGQRTMPGLRAGSVAHRGGAGSMVMFARPLPTCPFDRLNCNVGPNSRADYLTCWVEVKPVTSDSARGRGKDAKARR